MRNEFETNYLITIPARGIKVIPPDETLEKMAKAKRGEKIGKWTEEEKIRLQLIINSGILKKRYPTPQEGESFMKDVDYERRQKLLDYSYELGEHITLEWKKINENKPIAIILFGSVTRGLVKKAGHPDPSNIDMSVIGDITDCERLLLLDSIRPKRMEIKERILSDCSNIPNGKNECSGNAGVFVQNTEKLVKNNYSQAIEYIKARAISIHDPLGIWGDIERFAILAAKKKFT